MNNNNNNQQAAAATVNKAAKKSQKQTADSMRKPSKGKKAPGQAGREKKMLKTELRRRGYPEGDLKQWMRSLGKPFSMVGILCPVGFNPVPSFFKTVGRTTILKQQFVVPAGRSSTFYIFGGHGAAPDAILQVPAATTMDGVSYHSQVQEIGGTGVGNRYSIGPVKLLVNTDTYPACGGVFQEDHITGDLINNTTIGSAKPLLYDKDLPYTLTAANGGHGRWQQNSAGINVQNVTPEIGRGGSVVTCLPIPARYGPTKVSDLVQFPSFHDHGPSMRPKGEGVAWFPKPTDVAFWHTSAPGSSSSWNTTMEGVGLICVLTAPAGNAQTYDVEMAFNWQFAGSFFQTVASAAPTRNENLPVASTVVQLLGATAKSGTSAITALDAVANHPAASAVGSGIVDALVTHVKNAAFSL